MTGRESSYVFEYRIAFLGAAKVGKTALIEQIVTKTFNSVYQPTVSNHLTHVVEYEDHLCVCLLVDTAGLEDFPAMRKLAVTKGNAFVVVYAIDDRKSFLRAQRLIDEIKFLKGPTREIRVVLVGNKTDRSREVFYKEGLQYATSIHNGNVISTFVESSAKNRESTLEILYKILKMFLPPVTPIEEYKEKKDKRFYMCQPPSRLSNRKTSKSLTLRKTHDSPLKKEFKKGYSESNLLERPVNFKQLSPKLFVRSFRKRSKSIPNIKALQGEEVKDEIIRAPRSLTPKLFRKRTESLSPRGNEISRPTLLSHSMTLNRYAQKTDITPSLESISSGDSGLSEGSNKSDLPELLPFRRPSLPGRRRSISERMMGIFKRSKSVANA